MKKILLFLPAIIFTIFYGLVVVIAGLIISRIVIVWLALFYISGFILMKKQFWGSLLGMLPAIQLIYMGTQETGQIIKETPIGIVVLIYYLICGGIVYKKYRST